MIDRDRFSWQLEVAWALVKAWAINGGVLLLLVPLMVLTAGPSRGLDEVCLVAELPEQPTEVDASDGQIALCSPIFDHKGMIWPEEGFPMRCEIEFDGVIVVQTGDVGPGVAYELIDPSLRDEHLLQSWCTSAHIEGRGTTLAAAPIPARFPPSPVLEQPGRPFFVPLQ